MSLLISLLSGLPINTFTLICMIYSSKLLRILLFFWSSSTRPFIYAKCQNLAQMSLLFFSKTSTLCMLRWSWRFLSIRILCVASLDASHFYLGLSVILFTLCLNVSLENFANIKGQRAQENDSCFETFRIKLISWIFKTLKFLCRCTL